MSRFWEKTTQIAPILAIYLLLPSKTEAIELPEFNNLNFNQQAKFTSPILNRQEDFVSNAHLKNTDSTKIYLSQINNIKELQDIKPTDWSYEALRVLIDRYGCISGFPDQTYGGEKNLSRAEFVAALNTCLNKIESVIVNSDPIAQTDVDTILRLMQEFQADLAILQGRTDSSQARLQDLEATQFSNTSKLKGEAIFSLGSVLSSDQESNSVLGSRLRLELETSFRGNDLLSTRLSRSEFPGFSSEIETFQGNLSFAEPDNDDFQLELLQYTFGVGDNTDFILGATGISADDIASTVNFLDGDGGSGAISAFGTRNPIYYPPGDAGVGIVHRPMDKIIISAGYLASPANESSSGSGLFNGPYSALGQIMIAPIESLSFATTYIHSYNQSDTETGTNRANIQSQTENLFGEESPTVSNSYGLEVSWTIKDRLIVGGWGGLSKVSSLSPLNQQIERGTQDIWNWAATLALPDLGKEGSIGGLIVGMEPTVTNSTINTNDLEEDGDRSWHLEAFYQYQVNDNISITPGVVWITEPDSNTPNPDDLFIGTIRTTFSF